MDKFDITALVCTQNESKVIQRTLAGLSMFDQVIVIDSASTDNTVELAEESGVEVVRYTWNGKYPKKKQWSLLMPQIKHDWVLFVDADEYPTEIFLRELEGLKDELEAKKYGAYDIPLTYHFLGRRLKHGYKVTKRSLVDRNRVAYPEVDDLAVTTMWEIEGHYQPNVDGPIGAFVNSLEHYDIDPLFGYFKRHNSYSDWEAFLRLNPQARNVVAGARSRNGKIWDAVPMKPLAFFVYSYLFKGGFRDGEAGFHTRWPTASTIGRSRRRCVRPRS